MLGSELHKAARAWAARGVPVFPCIPDQKKPATPHGYLNATTDPHVIDGWWEVDEYNVALSPGAAGWAVLDIDPDKGGWESLNAYEISYGVPETFTTETPSGGQHLWFQGTLPRNTASKLGKGLDTRSIGGYVLVPPSRTEAGSYRVVRDLPLAPLPEWLAEAVVAQRNVSQAGSVDLDLPVNLTRFKEYARSLRPATAGTVNEAGTSLVGVACDMALSRDAAWPIIVEQWGARCLPPFGMDDKLYDCGLWTQRQNSGHPLALTATGEEVFKHLIPDDLKAVFERFYPYTVDELDDRPEPTWLLDNIIRERSIGYFFGDSGAYKSYLTLFLCLLVAQDREVIYVVGEGEDIVAKRVRALETLMGREHRLRIVTEMPMVQDVKDVHQFVEVAKRFKLAPALVVLDTLSTAMGALEEAKDSDMRKFILAMKHVRDELKCAVLAIHHTGQLVKDRERGSYVLRGDVDFAGEVKSPKRGYTGLTMKKQRGAPLPAQPFTFKGVPVGKELAFQAMDLDDYEEATGTGSALDPRTVGRALADHGITTLEKAVPTDVLATWLRLPEKDEPPELLERALAQVARDLKKRALKTLWAYTNGTEGSGLRWFTPAADDPDAGSGTAGQ